MSVTDVTCALLQTALKNLRAGVVAQVLSLPGEMPRTVTQQDIPALRRQLLLNEQQRYNRPLRDLIYE